MKIAHSSAELDIGEEGTVATVGVFDGVHKGHQRIIKTVVEKARRLGCRSLVITFDRHPAEVLDPKFHPPILTAPKLKAELIAELGVDLLLELAFDEKLAQMSATEFVKRILVEAARCRAVVVGAGFRFGKKAQGSVGLLRELGKKYGFDLVEVSLVEAGDESISSTRIRTLLKAGRLEEVRKILGRYPRITGRVVAGHGRGAAIGYPTANIKTPDRASVPGQGVYAGRIWLDHQMFHCVVDIGTSPTFGDVHRMEIHAHVLGFKGELYNREVELELVARLRDERAFANAKELAGQIKADIKSAVHLMSSGENPQDVIARHQR